MKVRCGGLLFIADFDSANLNKVEYVSPANVIAMAPSTSACDSNITEHLSLPPQQKIRYKTSLSSPLHIKKPYLKKKSGNSSKNFNSSDPSHFGKEKSILEFNVWTKPDCFGTSNETTFRTWFHFGIEGAPPGTTIKINVMNLNRQGKLYFHGMKPVYKVVPSKEGWKRIAGKVDFRCENEGNFIISFCHTMLCEEGTITYFAFTFPFSYTECQNMLDDIDKKLGSSLNLSKINKPSEATIYYTRELVCYSSDGNRIELLTVTSCKGLTAMREKRLPNLFPDSSKPRCHIFQNKKVVFISSRVHPGETPSSFVFNGLLHYLICSKDSIANKLRNLYVFKLIPMLNPDGVLKGHYRADLQGLNLNRIYMIANAQHHPSIYAARTLLLHYHSTYSSVIQCASRTNLKKSKSGLVFDTLTTNRLQRRNVVPPAAKKITKEVLTQAQKKNAVRKYAGDNLLKRQNILPSLSTNLRNVASTSGKEKLVKSKVSSSNLLIDSVETTGHCSTSLGSSSIECTSPACPSKELPHDEDTSCNCIEASDAEDSSTQDREIKLGEGDASTLLKDIPCLKPEESGIAYYFDLHGHASKRGCFIYGNYFPDVDKMVECMLLPKLMSINCPYFDFSACNFSAENMYSGTNTSVQSKEGSGRVSLYVLTGIIHSYTLECNYNTCRFVTQTKRSKGPMNVPSPVSFSPEIYQQVGESLLVSILDAAGQNPKSKICHSPLMSVQGVKEWLRQHALSVRGRCTPGYVIKDCPITRAKSQEKTQTSLMKLRRSSTLWSSSMKDLQQESSSSNANLSSNPSDSDCKSPSLSRMTRAKTNRSSTSVITSPINRRPSLLRRRHTFSHTATFAKPTDITTKSLSPT